MSDDATAGERSSTRRSVLRGLGAGAAGAAIGGAGTAAADEHEGKDEKGGDRGGDDAAVTRLRIAHMAESIPAIDVYVDGDEAFSDVDLTDVTDYADLDPGVHKYEVRLAGRSSTVFKARAALGPGDYTVAALSDDDGPVPVLLQDTADPESTPGAGSVARFVHGAPDAPAVTITTGGGRTLFEDVSFGEATDYMPVPTGRRTLLVHEAGDEDALVAEITVKLRGGSAYTTFAVPDDPADFVAAEDVTED